MFEGNCSRLQQPARRILATEQPQNRTFRDRVIVRGRICTAVGGEHEGDVGISPRPPRRGRTSSAPSWAPPFQLLGSVGTRGRRRTQPRRSIVGAGREPQTRTVATWAWRDGALVRGE